jgi:hypothetical protein
MRARSVARSSRVMAAHRSWRDLIELHVADLGGVAALSEAQRSLIKRAPQPSRSSSSRLRASSARGRHRTFAEGLTDAINPI